MKWMVLYLGGKKWTIYLVTTRSKWLRDSESGEPLDGYCDYDTLCIYVNKNLSEDLFKETLIHECLHAAIFTSGAHRFFVPGTDNEENLVAVLSPYIHGMLRDMGCRIPYLSKSASLDGIR